MNVLSLPASMQQELAARALRACMAAEAALASLRAECKPLQAVSPQRGLELKKNMGNAHRSLRLQIEACENFSLSATAAFKQLCDVFFNGDSGSNFRFHHTNLSHVHSPSMSSMTRLSSVAGNLDGDLPDCSVWRPELDVVTESSPAYKEKEIGDTGISAPEKHSAGVQVETSERSVAWKLDNEGLHSRLAPPKTYLMVINNSDEDAAAAAPRSNDEAGQDLDPTAREPPNHQDTNTVESAEFQESRIDEDSDGSDSDVELNCEISSLRRNSTLPVKFTDSQHDDAAALDTRNSEICRLAAVSADDVQCSSTAEDKPTSDPAPRNFEYENQATQTGEAGTDSEKNSCVGESDASSKHQYDPKIRVQASDGGKFLANSSGFLPATPPSAASETQGRCDAHKDEAQPRDLQFMQTGIPPAQPPLPRVHASWAITEMTCTQAPTPSSSPPHFSWSSEAAHNVEFPNRGHPDVLLENHNPSAVSYASTRASFTCLKSPSPDLPLYSSRPQFQIPPLKGGNSQQEHHHSSSAATLANGIVPEKASSLFESRGDLMVSLQMKKENSFAPSNHTPPYSDQNYFEEPSGVPVAPSPYTLKTRSMFTRTTSSPVHKVMSDLPVPSSVQGSNEHYGTSLYAMAAAVSVTPGYRRSSSGSGTMSSASLSSPYHQPTAERQHKHNMASMERPQLTQYSIYPTSTTLASSSSSSWDTSSSKASAGCDKSSRPAGGVEYYRKEFEHLQEQFPRAHGSFHEGHLKVSDNNASQGITLNPQYAQFGLPLPTVSSTASTALQNMRRMSCTAMPQRPQRPQMRAVITAMEQQGGLPHNEGYNHVMGQNEAKGRAIGGGGYMQGISCESTCYGSKVCLDSQSADDGMKGSNFGVIKFPDNCSMGGQPQKSLRGIRDLIERDLNKSELSQELASWPGLRLSWDEGSTDGEGERPFDCKMTESGLGGGMEQTEETDSDEDDDSLGTQGEWQAILGSLRKGDKSNFGASSILKSGIACCPSI